ncbi:hypothetical protein SCA6_009539 [Theobroma cacao]
MRHGCHLSLSFTLNNSNQKRDRTCGRRRFSSRLFFLLFRSVSSPSVLETSLTVRYGWMKELGVVWFSLFTGGELKR